MNALSSAITVPSGIVGEPRMSCALGRGAPFSEYAMDAKIG